ncbi:MAG TPA: ribbon-helix-helix domain-containing protein [Thermodesulfobacteriota bacterium]|nr:ribbon-helix-helix domain-containing protein [Thermodesulfobacteriota bacterium]
MKNSDVADRIQDCIRGLKDIIEEIKQEDGKLGKAEKTIEVTYYMDPALIRRLKLLGVERDRDLSGLVNEAVALLLEKYGQGR